MAAFLAYTPLLITALLLQVSIGALSTYTGLDMADRRISETWIGAMTAGHYLGLVLGGRLAHLLVTKVGHIRAFSACVAMAACAALGLLMSENLVLWLALRVLMGLMIVTCYVSQESWLNEQTGNALRGRVFSAYMVATSFGNVLGQLLLTWYKPLAIWPLLSVSMFMSISLVPMAAAPSAHPPTPNPAPLDFPFFLKRVPHAMIAMLIGGFVGGSFYGLAAVYILKLGFSDAQAPVFTAVAVTCGLLSQWPMGWLSDKMSRVRLLRLNAIIMAVLAALLWGWAAWPWWFMLVLACAFGVLQQTIYPMALAIGNDRVEPERRVSLSAVLLMVYSVGASLGPLIAGVFMSLTGPAAYYVFVSACGVALAWFIREKT